jgi:glycosyltransferase involved in cell wall biosynthesis
MMQLRRLSLELGIENTVTFLGRIEGELLFSEYAEAEIFCGFSRSEALGNVFLEAQAAGCAVVATTVGGIPEIVLDQKTGLLVSPDDPEAAAEALNTLFSDTDLRRRLASAGKTHAASYGWDEIAERYLEVLNG